ncbi:MAG: hypothetical protein RL154_1241, partial [Pseudomonadota bacterium]
IKDFSEDTPLLEESAEEFDFNLDENDAEFLLDRDKIEDSSILADEDVSEIKNLLSDEEDVFDMPIEDNTSIDSLDMLSEGMVADALGLDIDDNIASEIEQTSATPAIKQETQQYSASEVDAIVSAIREALTQENVTINITITRNTK